MRKNESAYKKFDEINGAHPWRDVSPEGYIDYPADYRKGGRVIYFNFPLARELGLIPQEHPAQLTKKLEITILKTFSLQIINEYEQMKLKRFSAESDQPRIYMATRYLQSQHKNKQGKTSGDGRSIWNGFIRTKTKTFDISSRGTGVTQLSPGAQEAGKPIATGDETFGYSSGLAELDEMLAGAIMSEIFYREGIPTERCLTVIDYQDNTSVGVRVAPNLIRPAHIFRYLKMGKHNETRRSLEYFLKRQEANGVFILPQKGQARYEKALEYFSKTYAKLAAVMEQEYIFNWLSWDGDNMLADGAILDYGSIRQFAAKHNKYRYEDVDRYSSCLTEQRYWARKIVQTFIQTMDFIRTREKKPLIEFDEDKRLNLFDEAFTHERQKRMLWRVGFTVEHIQKLLADHVSMVENFRSVQEYFEDVKTAKGEKQVADGIDHPPVFLIRDILRELPKFILKKFKNNEWPLMNAEKFCNIMAASYSTSKDLELTDNRIRKAYQYQELYRDLILALKENKLATIKTIAKRSEVVNYEFRGTGDGLTWIVKEAIEAKDRMDRQQFQKAMDRFIESQVLVPGKWKPLKPSELKGRLMKARHLRAMKETLEFYKELI